MRVCTAMVLQFEIATQVKTVSLRYRSNNRTENDSSKVNACIQEYDHVFVYDQCLPILIFSSVTDAGMYSNGKYHILIIVQQSALCPYL